uniref:Secreted protein n=1 Tax=Parascaris equorum TaxID=6256 RepID=A0A914S5F2_PAREQ
MFGVLLGRARFLLVQAMCDVGDAGTAQVSVQRCEERTAALKSSHRVSQMGDPTDAIRRHKSESEEEKMTTPANCIFVLVVMLIV